MDGTAVLRVTGAATEIVAALLFGTPLFQRAESDQLPALVPVQVVCAMDGLAPAAVRTEQSRKSRWPDRREGKKAFLDFMGLDFFVGVDSLRGNGGISHRIVQMLTDDARAGYPPRGGFFKGLGVLDV
jgi:hypothetical protein